MVGEVVLEPMYEVEVRKLATKTRVEVITVIEGTSKVVFEAEFRRVQPSGFGFPLYECVLTVEMLPHWSAAGKIGRCIEKLNSKYEWKLVQVQLKPRSL